MSIRIQQEGTTLAEAVKAARRSNEDDKKIILEEGDYYIDDTIRLTEADSGLTIEGEGEVHLYGGRSIGDWKACDDNFWRAPVPAAKNGDWDFRMLIVNDRFASRARYPEVGYLMHESEFDVEWLSTYEGGFERNPTEEELTTLIFKPEDIPADFVPGNAEITVFHMWDESLVGVKSIDRDANIIKFSNPSGWPPGAFAGNFNFERRYVVWNTKEGMINPGQWYLDRQNGELVYWPIEGETIDDLRVVAPVLENLIVMEGSEENPVTDIAINKLHMSATNAPLMSGAFGAKLFDGALSLRHVKNTELTNLHIYNVGAHCIKAAGDNITINGCSLYNAGAGAIRCVGSKALIRNNHIHDIGKTFPSAIALYVGATDPNVPEEWEPGQAYHDCTIEHNELHDVPYAAICAGGKNLLIQKNLIYRAMTDLYDGAGIYVTFCDDAIIRHNFIRDIKDSPGAGTSAYYLDEKTVNCLVEENMEINVPRPSHNHISKDNIFRNNFFIIKDKGRFTMERSEGYTFEKNVVIAEQGFEMFDMAFCPHFRDNVMFSGSGKLITKDLNRYEVLKEYELEIKDGNINADPKLISYENGIIEFAADSPALALGIKAIDVSGAGNI